MSSTEIKAAEAAIETDRKQLFREEINAAMRRLSMLEANEKEDRRCMEAMKRRVEQLASIIDPANSGVDSPRPDFGLRSGQSHHA